MSGLQLSVFKGQRGIEQCHIPFDNDVAIAKPTRSMTPQEVSTTGLSSAVRRGSTVELCLGLLLQVSRDMILAGTSITSDPRFMLESPTTELLNFIGSSLRKGAWLSVGITVIRTAIHFNCPGPSYCMERGHTYASLTDLTVVSRKMPETSAPATKIIYKGRRYGL